MMLVKFVYETGLIMAILKMSKIKVCFFQYMRMQKFQIDMHALFTKLIRVLND